METAAELIEQQISLIGVTALEDKLQELVVETIEKLLEADIRVWMLTGDKQSTAMNIAKSCHLHKGSSQLLDLSHCGKHSVETEIKYISKKLQREGLVGQNNEITLIIDGKTLVRALQSEIRTDFIKVCTSCRTVICCRVSPTQKSDMVAIVTKFTQSATLAIGDGANDVAMIQKASVGVGVSGHEGLQAVNHADFSLGQFSHLSRLLLVHGAWNYSRISNVILYSFYKNIALFITDLWFAYYSCWGWQLHLRDLDCRHVQPHSSLLCLLLLSVSSTRASLPRLDSPCRICTKSPRDPSCAMSSYSSCGSSMDSSTQSFSSGSLC